jgi:hypothetical protein
MGVCVYSVFVLSCVGSGLATGLSLVQGVLPTVYKCKITESHKEEAKARYGLDRRMRRRKVYFLKYCEKLVLISVYKIFVVSLCFVSTIVFIYIMFL